MSDPSPLIVVNLGLPKSGTTTLARALRRAGLATADYRIRREQTNSPDLAEAFVGERLYTGYFASGDPLQHLTEFSAFTEISLLRGSQSLWPQMDWALIQSLREHHPGLRFVASRRDALLISDSMLRWSNFGTSRLPNAQVPGLPRGFGATTAERVRWIEGHYAALRHFFAGSSDYLEYNTAAPDAPAQLSAFLGIDLPWWGKSNVNPKKTIA